MISHEVNDAFILINRVLKNGGEVYWLNEPAEISGHKLGPGTIFVPEHLGIEALLQQASRELGLDIQAVEHRPSGSAVKLKPIRIGLWDQYGGSVNSGWLRWIFEQYEFPFEVVYPQKLDQADLSERFDVLVLPHGAMQPAGGEGRGRVFEQPKPEDVPEEFRTRLGRITAEKTVPKLHKFVEGGGTIIALGGSTSLAQLWGLPLKNGLLEKQPDGKESPLSREKFYVPGAILRASVDLENPVGYGMEPVADVFFDNSPVFRLNPDAEAKGVRPVVWFSNAAPLRSGWAWGQGYLEDTVAAAEARLGKGRLCLLGIDPAFRGQSHGTYKLLFNSLYIGAASEANH